MIELKKCRDKIDALDRELLRLFEERMHIVKEVAGIKKANGIGICDSSREDELIAAMKIMELSKLYQSRCLEEKL